MGDITDPSYRYQASRVGTLEIALRRMTAERDHYQKSNKTMSDKYLATKDALDQAIAERDALGIARPYDCYWSRRALAAERKLEELSRGNNAPGEPKEETVKRRLLLNPDAAEGNGPSVAGNETSPPEAKPRIDAITAKMKQHSAPTRNGDTENVAMQAVYAETGVNKQWSTMTPCGSLSLSISNPNAQGFIQGGKEYIVTIREAQPGE